MNSNFGKRLHQATLESMREREIRIRRDRETWWYKCRRYLDYCLIIFSILVLLALWFFR